MDRDTKSMFFGGTLCLIIAVLYGIFPYLAPVNSYLAVGSMSFISGLLLAFASFAVAMKYKQKKEVK